MPAAATKEQKNQGNGAPAAHEEDDAFLEGIAHEGLREVLAAVRSLDPDQAEYLSAVREVAASLQPLFERRPELLLPFRTLCEPERQIVFRVPWLDDAGELRINRGFRVQVSSALGPYKGGLRFREGTNLSICKFLGFEQTLKNALTTLPLGSGKGGADFDPKDKSDNEVMRFCQSYMTELYRHIGGRVDVPAGDIGVGVKEIGYLFGQFKRITGMYTASLTGKGVGFGGSEIRPEATGFGVVLFAECALEDAGDKFEGKRCIVSGSGNVASHCAMKLIEKGAIVLTMSDSKGYIYEKEGITAKQLEQIMEIKSKHSGRLDQYKSDSGGTYVGDRRRPWEVDTEVDMAFPCATQNEVGEEDAQQLVDHGCKYVFEGANMPCEDKAVKTFEKAKVTFGPAKAANAGGVAVSGLEMVQNRVGLQWSREEVSDKLKEIMQSIYKTSKEAAEEYNTSLAAGANIAAFLRVGEAVLAQGAV